MSSPPAYSPTSSGSNGPYETYDQSVRPASVRHRKSSTIIPIVSDEASNPDISPARSTALLPDLGSHGNSSRSSFTSQTHVANEEDRAAPRSPVRQNGPIPPHMHELERRVSNSSSAAEEGEATPLLGDDTAPKTKWHEGPMFMAGVKFAALFAAFTLVVGLTFYFGVPKLAP